ncbi:energy-coupling factor transporter transmembrane component T family protein [Desulfuribacillus alkaliarsenatis]|uniref:Cobalt ABC transporter permease n=1 Tax=Desulfuribacillus alkaliarsenatis TaxID=766136 RepID=A0A1E5G482_9FIRM|nr:energy-coupling factor transporter transmembrane component T [Desulfuribacillus alkaliarsenatis]OEF97907.1 cobalt ABC transporter permease [Desulfuribacillus alkaliarsenatis]
MLNQVLIGQYIAVDSFIHRLDPRTKLLGMFALVFVVFSIRELYQLFILAALVVTIYGLANIKASHLYRGMRPILWFVYLTFLLHIFINKDGQLLWNIGFLSIYTEGLYQGALISFRLFTLIYFSTILTITTPPISMTEGIETILSPFKKLIPVHEIALMLTISIRFIPTIVRETDKLIKAQMARGGSIVRGKLSEKMKHIIPLVVPLLIMSFKRADELATAMEARCYRGSIGRTKFKKLKYSWRDTIVAIILFIVITIVLWGRF